VITVRNTLVFYSNNLKLTSEVENLFLKGNKCRLLIKIFKNYVLTKRWGIMNPKYGHSNISLKNIH
jgi:hypothetical protein